MPLQRCEVRGRSGWRWGSKGKCYTYNENDERSERRAKSRAKAEASKPKAANYSDGLEVKGSDG